MKQDYDMKDSFEGRDSPGKKNGICNNGISGIGDSIDKEKNRPEKKDDLGKRDGFSTEDSFDREDGSGTEGCFAGDIFFNEGTGNAQPAHGGDIYSYVREYGANLLDFSVNTNPLGLPKGVAAAIRAMSREHCAYPDVYCRDLRKEISRHEQIPAEYIFCGNGAADIIFRIACGLVPKRALLTAPAFSEYEKALRKAGCGVDYFKLNDENDFIIDAGILEKIAGHDILFVCNPNNPTGQVTEKALLLQIARECGDRGCILVIDECFIEFLEQPEQYTLRNEIESHTNLIILKAFTKTYAMAGLRLGYCMTANKSCLEKISEAGQPWAVSTVAQTAGIAALKESEYVSKARAVIAKERNYLSKELRKAGMKVFGSSANFILFYAAGMPELYTGLLKRGILIRGCDNFVNLSKGYFRIAVKNHSCNKKLVDALREMKRVKSDG